MVKTQGLDQQVVESTLINVMQATFNTMCNLEFTSDPVCNERELIEYNSRMRVNGLEKFNEPCYVSAVSYYLSPKELERRDACGAFVIYIEHSVAANVLRGVGDKRFDEDDEELVLDNCGEFCKIVAGNFKNELSSSGYVDLTISDPMRAQNQIPEGVNFPYSQYKYYEVSFDLLKKKSVVVDIVLSVLPKAS